MGGRARVDSAVGAVVTALARAHGNNRFGIEFNNGLLLGDTVAIHAAGLDVDSLARVMASAIARTSGVTRLYTPRILAQADSNDLDAMRWRRSIPAEVAWLAAASLAPGYIWSFSPAATTHGTTNRDDVQVPILFMGPGITPARPTTRARTVDIGPTLAALLGVRPLEAVEGHPLPEVVRAP